MKRILLVFLALILVSCGVPAPTQTAAVPEPSMTPVVIVETVVVTVVPTNIPVEVPTDTPVPPPTQEPTLEPTLEPTVAAPAAVEPPAETAGGVTAIEESLGAGWFTNITQSRNDFSLRCQLNKQITFSVKATSTNIKQVDLWYRFQDRSNGAVFEWVNAGKMIPDNQGNFTVTLSGDQVNPNFRKPNSWFDYQFVGYNATGVVGRSDKIQQRVSYTFDCP